MRLELSVCLWLALGSLSAHAQERTVRTASGVSFALPTRFVPDPSPLADTLQGVVKPELALVDGDTPAIHLLVATFTLEGDSALHTLPAQSGPLPAPFAEGYVAGLAKSSPGQSVVLGEWDAARHAFSARLVGRAASSARVLATQSDDSPSWQRIAQAGGDVTRTRCLLAALLKDGDDLDVDRASSRVGRAAKACQLAEADVAAYVRAQPEGFFVGASMVTLAVNYLMPNAMTVVSLVGEPKHTAQLERLLSSIWVSARVEGAEGHASRVARLFAFSQVQPARALGFVLGSLVGGAVMLVLCTWLLTRLRAPIAVAIAIPAGALLALASYQMATAGTPSAYETSRLVGYLLAGLLSFKPLRRRFGPLSAS